VCSSDLADNARERLTIADEREHVLFFLVEVIYEVIPAFYEEIEAALAKVFGDGSAVPRVAEMLHFGAWVGGDMDGHPARKSAVWGKGGARGGGRVRAGAGGGTGAGTAWPPGGGVRLRWRPRIRGMTQKEQG